MARKPLMLCFDIDAGDGLRVRSPAYVAAADSSKVIERGLLEGA